MKRQFCIIGIIFAIFWAVGTNRLASEQKLPLIKGKKIVATVNEEPITLDEFNQEVSFLKNVG